MITKKRNFELLHDGTLNKSVAFTTEEREQLGLRGLLPYSIVSQDIQVKRVMNGIKRKAYDIERYILLSSLQDRNEKLFYRVVISHIEEIMPLIYTPTVGQACKEFSHIFRRSKGFYITPDDKGEISKILDNWPEKDIRVIVCYRWATHTWSWRFGSKWYGNSNWQTSIIHSLCWDTSTPMPTSDVGCWYQ